MAPVSPRRATASSLRRATASSLRRATASSPRRATSRGTASPATASSTASSPASSTASSGQGGYPAAPQAGFGAPGAAPPRPATVTNGIYAFIAATVVGLISSIITFASFDTILDNAYRDAGIDPNSVDASVSGIGTGAATAGAIFGLVFFAAYCAVIWFAYRGKNWARIVLFVLGGLSLLSVFNIAGTGVALITITTILQLLLIAVGIFFLAQKASSQWYAAMKGR